MSESEMDPLHEAIEKAMREGGRLYDKPGATLLMSTAVSVAADFVRRERETAEYWSKSNIATANLAVGYLKRAEAAEKERDEARIVAQKETRKRSEAEIALAEYRKKLGHVAGCRCHRGDGSSGSRVSCPGFYEFHIHPFRDPRCAPGVER